LLIKNRRILIRNLLKNKLFSNSAYSYLFSGLSLLSSIFAIPVVLNYLGETNYGIWVTLYSVFAWLALLDGGFGNSLRNELAKNLQQENFLLAKQNITTSYVSISIFLCLIIVIFLILNIFLPWNDILEINEFEISFFVGFLFSLFIFQLVFKLIVKILFAFNKASYGFLIHAICNIFILINILLLKEIFPGQGLWLIGLIYSLSPIVVFLIFSFFFFNYYKPEYKPRLKFFRKEQLKILTFKGSKFFIIDVNLAFIQASMPLLITNYFSADNTTDYYITLRYYSIIIVLLNIVLQNLWTPITNAWVNFDQKRLFKYLKFKKNILLFFSFALLILWFISLPVYQIWIGDTIVISSKINGLNFLFVFSLIFYRTISNYLSAINELKALVKISIINLVTFIPLCYVVIIVFDLGLHALMLTPSIILILKIIIIYKVLSNRFKFKFK